MGYVTCGQFRQCLSVLGMSAGPDETALMERRFADDKGFNYLAFLEELQPAERLEDKYQTRMGTLLLSKQDTVSWLIACVYDIDKGLMCLHCT